MADIDTVVEIDADRVRAVAQDVVRDRDIDTWHFDADDLDALVQAVTREVMAQTIVATARLLGVEATPHPEGHFGGPG